MTVTRRFSPLSVILTLAVSMSAAEDVDASPQLTFYMRAAAASLADDQHDALKQIKDEDRRNLAMTYYLRAADTVGSRWSWSEQQIEAFERSAEFAATLVEIDKVAQRFAADNPPYTLYVNTEVRSLEEQLRRWQTVRSIGIAAKQLRADALAHLQQSRYPTASDGHANRFREFLMTWRASPSPTIAAPGLSLHGRGRAYDFQIQDRNGRVIAAPDASTIRSIWDGKGWTEKLSRAVRAASDKFVGPLATEPWHYEYQP